MWHEARKMEKKIRGMMVDYKKRAERRRDFYEKIRRDPVEFLQVHGSRMKINIDINTAIQAEKSLVPWRGDETNMIDRFDVRAHLDVIPTSSENSNSHCDNESMSDRINYERWKTLISNDFLGISEDRALQLIEIQERYSETKRDNIHQEQRDLKKQLTQTKCTIGYNYNTNDPTRSKVEESGSSSESEPEVEEVNIDPQKLESEQVLEINSIANKFGVMNDSFMKFMDEDRIETERIKAAKEIEHEKSLFSGRKARRERRNFNQKMSFIVRTTVPTSKDADNDRKKDERDDSSSDSETPVKVKTEFITSFGGSSGDEKNETTFKPTVTSKSKKRNSSRGNYRNFESDLKSLDQQERSLPPVFKERHSRTFMPKNSTRKRSRSRSKSRDRVSRKPRSHDVHRRGSRRSSSGSSERSRDRRSNRRRRSRSKSYERSRQSRSHRSKRSDSKERRRRRSRTRSKSVDEFGRKIGLRKTLSPEPIIKEVVGDSAPSTAQPPPPIKKYYRPELDQGSDSELEEVKAELESESKRIVSETVVKDVNAKVGNPSSSRHRQLMKITREKIESQYKLDKKAQILKSKESMRERDHRRGGRHSSSDSSTD